MKFLQKKFDQLKPLFEKGGKFEKFYPIYEGHRTIFFAPDIITGKKGAQIKDATDLKRLMMTVIIAMIPCLIFGMWNVGHQHFIATGVEATLLDKFWIGILKVVPIIAVSYGVGLLTEFTFCVIYQRPVEEGFLVTGMLIPLVMPATIPLWQVAMATVFAVVIGKEVFGGTGMNILNVALTARVFLYFAYPSQISGDVWTYLGDKTPVDGFSGATILAYGAEAAANNTNMMELAAGHWYSGMFDFWNMFMGIIPGSIGETSVLMCLIGAIVLIATGVGSWKIMLSVVLGTLAMGGLFNLTGGNSFMEMPAHYHLVIGGLAFGAVFMATDPVSAAHTETGKWIYGFLIGVITVLIRVINPAYPEGIMLAILFMNVFAPLIDFYVVEANKKRRLKRATV
ncbi:Na+-transporting NADH:ubiquinone oxidoreductase subunit B [Ekhidna lutea]|uniref:Na(+)-translocating NADH-quinone reductase subunit B n=1 Tax=Ekhidna lutea TaxID=447679 RepID=A0A239L2H5_EKHLU|nr:NADH:ubiquinone reductase (Na(+)-transporting) subunit B [Ekhidna lutea]SNT24671.1 Na+-transporting NADH:ubiquinone oxidoreductase subunit B [Ekhidna lutea]